jgi:hypothetical protein
LDPSECRGAPEKREDLAENVADGWEKTAPPGGTVISDLST